MWTSGAEIWPIHRGIFNNKIHNFFFQKKKKKIIIYLNRMNTWAFLDCAEQTTNAVYYYIWLWSLLSNVRLLFLSRALQRNSCRIYVIRDVTRNIIKNWNVSELYKDVASQELFLGRKKRWGKIKIWKTLTQSTEINKWINIF